MVTIRLLQQKAEMYIERTTTFRCVYRKTTKQKLREFTTTKI